MGRAAWCGAVPVGGGTAHSTADSTRHTTRHTSLISHERDETMRHAPRTAHNATHNTLTLYGSRSTVTVHMEVTV
jgi:hypothetical protein